MDQKEQRLRPFRGVSGLEEMKCQAISRTLDVVFLYALRQRQRRKVILGMCRVRHINAEALVVETDRVNKHTVDILAAKWGSGEAELAACSHRETRWVGDGRRVVFFVIGPDTPFIAPVDVVGRGFRE
jgi:hypothetical protein